MKKFSKIQQNIKSIINGQSKNSGRNNSGKITVYNRGGGHKQKIRFVDFKQKNFSSSNFVTAFVQDPIRTALLALLRVNSSKNIFTIACKGLKIGDCIFSEKNWKASPYKQSVPYVNGNTLYLKHIKIGSPIFNIEYNGKSKIARSAKTQAQIIQKDIGDMSKVLVQFSSGIQVILSKDTLATLGVVSTKEKAVKKKAGQSRWLGNRPKVRGVAINSHDHPIGGGEGKTSGGRPSVTPWGLQTKGFRTVQSMERKKKNH